MGKRVSKTPTAGLNSIGVVLLIMLIVGGCSWVNEGLTSNFGGYLVKDGKVTYHTGMQGLAMKRSWEVEGADAATFASIGYGYGKDKNHAYLDGLIIPSSDGATFDVIKAPYAADKAHVFIRGYQLSDSPTTFKIIAELEKGTFSTDRKKVFYGSEEFLPGTVDAATFEQMGLGEFFRDKAHVYTPEKMIEGADPETFRALGTNNGLYAMDKDSVFYNATEVQGCNPKKHYVIKGSFHEDDKGVFYGTKKLTDDVKNFEVLKSEYSWDSKHVYWMTDVISDDVQNFRAFPTDTFNAYAKDNKNVFRCGEKVTGVDQVSFAGIDDRYAKDKDKVYFSIQCESKLSTVDGADPMSFELVIGIDNVDGKDKTNNYNFGTNRGPHTK